MEEIATAATIEGSVLEASHQETQPVTAHNPSTSISNSATSAPQVNPQGIESSSFHPHLPMKERLPPLQTTAGVFPTISVDVDVRGSMLDV